MTDGITNWRKASASGGSGTSCIETGWTDTMVGYRDSKQVSGPKLIFPASSARSFLAWIRR